MDVALEQQGGLRQLCEEISLVQCRAQWGALLTGDVLCGKQTLSWRDVPLSVFTKSSSIVHKSHEH